MSYSFKGRVRYSEIGEDGCLTLPGIQNYYQDCCTFQSENIGQGMEALEERQRAWVVSSWQIVVNRYPGLGETIVASTAPYGVKGFLGMRNFTLKTEDGELLSYANSIWTNIDTETGLPARLTDEDTRGYELDEKLEMDYAPRKIALPEGMEAQESFAIQKHHLDTNHHVNNCQYVQMALDVWEEMGTPSKIRELRVEYKKSAVYGEMIYPSMIEEQDNTTIVLGDEKERPYAIVQVRGEN